MKLAEALAHRSDAVRRVEQLRARVVASARYQEGETPAEDATRLLVEVDGVLDELEVLIRRINRTNASVEVGVGTLTDALARRDVLRLRHALVTAAADAAAGRDQRGQAVRQLRSELKMLAALPVAELRGQADRLAREVRELDMLIQRVNWEADVLE
ncbi:DIP1984 family protein [Micromonospora sp. NPDC050417]|uniref:DIP1984 family protein n=1 Tax=Micromonospora sp. NPDC050417 TaxID=3364280 RepID=UPI0037887ECC